VREEHLDVLACPGCRGMIRVESVAARRGDSIESGRLECISCRSIYDIARCIPRFVPMENYASSFGLEWTLHARTQYDRESGIGVSRRRFFEETRWGADMRGESILEVGSGSGRFTGHAAATGAFVVSMDYSNAVEANYRSNGNRPNVLIVQGDIYAMPLRARIFDKLFCFGVLQHTPDPRRAFACLPAQLKPGGKLAMDIYRRTFAGTYLTPKRVVRPITRRMDPGRLYPLVRRYVDFMWPVCGLIRRIPRFGPSLNWHLLVADYSRLGLRGDVLKEWAYLDTFDMLSPRYDRPAKASEVRRWFDENGLVDAEVGPGHNGIEGRGRIPEASDPT
jgi:SAM-dependent methyltransferase